MRPAPGLFLLLGVFLPAVACGGDVEGLPEDGSGGNGGGTGGSSSGGTPGTGGLDQATATCNALCQTARAACPSYPQAECRADCHANLAAVPAECQSVGLAYYGCLTTAGAAAFGCAADGSAQPRSGICSDALGAVLNCMM